uniref:uncharacterized protein LOC124007635 isoform X2 n=1 Tax=Oncorhynchus gorbuscha TaxID=8017 RepID=UPI001EAF39A0|nr:uncharacterized protein LOC124007635 isoform X2 [Oncorhynchus gorbuscha]
MGTMTTLLLLACLLACLSMALPYTVCGEPVNPFHLLKDRVDCMEKQLGKNVTPEEDLSATNAKLKLQVARVDTLRQENEGTSNKVAALEAKLNATEEDLEAQKVEVGRLRGLEENLNSSAAAAGWTDCWWPGSMPRRQSWKLKYRSWMDRLLVARLNATKTELEAEVQELKRDNRVNVALKGVASQSSLYGNGVASNAIDGTREPEYDKQSCSHTQDDTNPWWRVDLLGVYRVKAVNISTMHCCAERLDGAEIRIGNSLENNGINNPRLHIDICKFLCPVLKM